MDERHPTSRRHVRFSKLGDGFVECVRDSIRINDLLGKEYLVERLRDFWTVLVRD
jgi:hypothetical protein